MAITAKDVMELRKQTDCGMMECKKALTEADGNFEKAIEILRKTGLAKADKKAGRVAAEGRIGVAQSAGSAVLVEVNCETDFVAKTPDFVALCKDLCMQVAAASPLYVTRDQVPEADLAKEREIAVSQCAGKPPAAVQKIVEGKLEKYYQTICLVDQPFVKNPDVTVKELLTERITKLGENMVIRRFARFQLGA